MCLPFACELPRPYLTVKKYSSAHFIAFPSALKLKTQFDTTRDDLGAGDALFF